MSTFTIYLKDILGCNPQSPNIERIGLDKYPIFDEEYRDDLNHKIIEHFWFREIGVETVDMFVFMLNRKMNEIMPLFNQLYKSQALIINPMLTFSSDSSQSNSSSNKSSSDDIQNSSSKSVVGGTARAVSSDTPQVQLSGNLDYASAIQDNESQTDTDSTSDATAAARSESEASGSMTAHSEGFSGSVSQLLNDYRDTFLNIDMDIIRELDELFMQIWDNGDEFTQTFYTPFFPYGGIY